MSEQPYQLIDDEELALYLAVMRVLEAQGKAILSNPQLIEQEAFWTAQEAILFSALSPLLKEYTQRGAELALGELVSAFVDIEQELYQHVAAAASQNAAQLITNINSTTREYVNRLIQQSIQENWTLDELTMQLEGLFSPVRARLIAVTETTTSYLEGAEIAANELRNKGYLVTIIWQTVNDMLVCETCVARNGRAQGDGWTVSAAAHPGCRCFAILEATLIE